MVPVEALGKKQEFAIVIQPTAAFVARPDKGRPPGGSSPDIRYFDSSQTKKSWIGKCGQNAVDEMQYLLEYKEVLALKLYTLLGVKTPNVTLSFQALAKEIQDDFRRRLKEDLAEVDKEDASHADLSDKINKVGEPRLFIMSQFIEEFQSLGENCISNYRKLKKDAQYTVLSKTGQKIPLKGLGKALAVAGFLHDYDCIGNSGGNMGYVVHPNNTFAEVVKIDGGEALPFQLILDANKQHDPKQRNIIIATTTPSLSFKNLTISDQEEFIETVEKILALPQEEIYALFSQKALRDGVSQKTVDEWFQLLMARRDLFLSAYAPEVAAKGLRNNNLCFS